MAKSLAAGATGFVTEEEIAKLAGKQRFKLHYAPRFDMSKNQATEELIEQL